MHSHTWLLWPLKQLGVYYVYLHFTAEAQRGEATSWTEEWQSQISNPCSSQSMMPSAKESQKDENYFWRWIPALVEGIRTEEKLKELKPQVGVLQQGKHVRPMVIRACVSGPAPVTLGCSCYCVAGLPLCWLALGQVTALSQSQFPHLQEGNNYPSLPP